MKCTDFSHTLRNIKRQESEELIEAVLQHGGYFAFENDEDDEESEFYNEEENKCGPVILAYIHDEPIDMCVTEVRVKDNQLQIYGREAGASSEYTSRIYWDDIVAGHISYITEALPEPEKK